MSPLPGSLRTDQEVTTTPVDVAALLVAAPPANAAQAIASASPVTARTCRLAVPKLRRKFIPLPSRTARRARGTRFAQRNHRELVEFASQMELSVRAATRRLLQRGPARRAHPSVPPGRATR